MYNEAVGPGGRGVGADGHGGNEDRGFAKGVEGKVGGEYDRAWTLTLQACSLQHFASLKSSGFPVGQWIQLKDCLTVSLCSHFCSI